MKIANIDRRSSYLLNDLRNFNETFRKVVIYDDINIKTLFRRYIFGRV